jgi:hypothetical protein
MLFQRMWRQLFVLVAHGPFVVMTVMMLMLHVCGFKNQTDAYRCICSWHASW